MVLFYIVGFSLNLMLYLVLKSYLYYIYRGKIGASLHRSSRGRGIGGKPPYLMVWLVMITFPFKCIVSKKCEVCVEKG